MKENRKEGKNKCSNRSSLGRSLLAIFCLLLTLSVFSLSLFVNADDANPTTNTFFQIGRIPDIQYRIIERYYKLNGVDYIAQFSFPGTNNTGYANNVTTTISNSQGNTTALFTYQWGSAWTTGSGAFNLFTTELNVDHINSLVGYDFLYTPKKDSYRNNLSISDTTWNDIAYMGTELTVTHLWQIAYFSNSYLVQDFLSSAERITIGTSDPHTISLIPPELRQWEGQIYVEHCQTIIEINAPFSDEMPVYTLPIGVSLSVNPPSYMYNDVEWIENNIDPDRDVRIVDIFTGVKNALDVQLFGSFSILDLLYIVIGVSVVIAFLKLFAGG